MDGSPPGSSVHAILQVRILEWVAIPFSRGSSQPRDQTYVSTLQVNSLPSEPLGKPPSLVYTFRILFAKKMGQHFIRARSDFLGVGGKRTTNIKITNCNR